MKKKDLEQIRKIVREELDKPKLVSRDEIMNVIRRTSSPPPDRMPETQKRA